MAYAMLTNPVNGISDVVMVRDGKSAIRIRTEKPLTDDQMRDLYWTILTMAKTGKTLKEIINQR